jgi:hypothetical protein
MAASNLRSRISRLERATSDDDFLVVIIRNFSKDCRPYARIGGYEGAEIIQHHCEPFDDFEARAIAAAKGAGDRWVAITAYQQMENVA